MATLAAWMLAGFAVLTLAVRVMIQLIRTGGSGLVGFRRGAGPVDWLSGILFVGGMAMSVVSLVLVLQDSLDPIDALDTDAVHVVGIVLAASGGVSVFAAQLGMGASWRIGVSDDQDTALVTRGWFLIVRNPIYTAMIVAWIGFALLVPTWLSIAALVVLVVGLEVQVRRVEEPYLALVHGDAYGDWAARAGRFVPHFGRLNTP